MKKGVTPIIATIMLLLITVSLAGAAYTFLQGFFFSQVKKTFIIPYGGSYCANNIITVYVVNTGYQSDLNAGPNGDFVVASLDGTDIRPYLSGDPAVQSQQTTKVININCASLTQCGNAPCVCNPPGGPYSGAHTIDLGTSSSIQHIAVFCP